MGQRFLNYLKLLEVGSLFTEVGLVFLLTPRLEEYPSSGSLMHVRIAD